MAKTEYHLDLNKKIVYSKIVGKITADEFAEHAKEIRADASFDNSFNVITDFIKAEIDGGLEQAANVTDFISATKYTRGRFKLAIIAGDLSKDWAGIVQTIAGIVSLNATINVFDNMQSAEEWIAES